MWLKKGEVLINVKVKKVVFIICKGGRGSFCEKEGFKMFVIILKYIGLRWRWLAVVIIIVNYNTELITTVKSFAVQHHRWYSQAIKDLHAITFDEWLG